MGVSSKESTSFKTKDARVEVTSEEEGFTGVWFVAKIIDPHPIKRPNQVYVEYETLLDDECKEPLKEFVNSSLVRPLPPQQPGENHSFKLHDAVDGFHNDGWWSTGVITQVVEEGKKFKVTFSNPPDLLDLGAEDLRVHCDWVRGRWIRAKKKEGVSVVSPGSIEALKVNSEERASDSLNPVDKRMEWSTPSSMKPSTIKNLQKEKAKLVNPATENSTKEIEHADNSDLPLLPTDEGIHFSSTSTNGGARTNNSEKSKVDLSSENFSRGKRAPRTKRHRVDELENHTPQRLRSAGRPPKSLTEPQALAGGKRVGELEHAPEGLGGKSNVLRTAQMTDAETPPGGKNGDTVKCAEILPHPAEVLLDVSGDQQLVHDPPVDGITEADQLERHVESTGNGKGKRKRGRPPKLQEYEVGQQKGGKKLAKSPEITELNGAVTAEDMASGEVVLPVVVGLEATKVDGSVSNKEKIGVDENIFNGLVDKNSKSSSKVEVNTAKKDKLRSKKGMQVSVGKQEKDSLKRGRTLNIDAASPNQDPEDPSAGKNREVNGKDSLMKEAETPTVRLPFNMSDDEPLSMWLEAPKTADATSASHGRNVEQQCTTNSSQDIVIPSSQCNDQILPFAKSCLLWGTIESMDVFRLLPQDPHFRSLFSKKENSREGLAIALMVDFVSVVEKASTLQPDGPRNVIEDILGTLFELEDNGFDVNAVRDHLMKVLLTMDKLDELEGKAKEGTDQMEEEIKEVEDINNHLRSLREQQDLALSTKAEKDSTIAHLKSTVNGINESIRNVDLELKALVAAAPWQVG